MSAVPSSVVGSVGGAELSTRTVTVVDVVAFPAASPAIAVRACVPFVGEAVSQGVEYGATVSAAPRLDPSSWNCTLVTRTLSSAIPDTAIEPETTESRLRASIEAGGGGGAGAGGPPGG